MVGSTRRWAIAPPALQGETEELEEFPLSGEPVSGVSRSPSVPETETIAPPTESGALPVEVPFTPSDWVQGRTTLLTTPVETTPPASTPAESTRHATPSEEITGLRRAPEFSDCVPAVVEEAPSDTIPAPPEWGESDPPPRAG
jgi:hypothetical protein